MSASPQTIANLDAERSVLGAILLDNSAYNQAAALLDAEDFVLESNRRIFRRMGEMLDRSVAVDHVTLPEELLRSDELAAIGGWSYISSLTDGLPRLSNIEHYCHIVKEKATLRQLAHVSNATLQDAVGNSEDSDVILARATDRVLSIATGASKHGPVLLSDYLESEFPTLDSISERSRRKPGLVTGFRRIDELTRGLQPSDLIIIAARPSMGKTSAALGMLLFIGLVLKLPALMFSLEMSMEALVLRLISALARVNSHRLGGGSLSSEEWLRVAAARKALETAPILIDDGAELTLGKLRAHARRIKQERGLAIVILDYIQLMTAPRAENRTQEITALSRGLKIAAKELDVPLVALSQLSRAPEQRTGDHRPQLSDLRESGSLEQDADLVAFLWREEYYLKMEGKPVPPDVAGLAEFTIAKQRNGPTGTVPLIFSPEWASFAGFTTGGAGA